MKLKSSLLGNFYILIFTIVFALPCLLLIYSSDDEAAYLALLSSFIFIFTFRIAFFFSFRLNLRQNQVGSFLVTVKKMEIFKFLLVTLISLLITGFLFGTFGNRGELISSNINTNSSALLSSLITPFLDVIGAFYLAKGLVYNSNLKLIIAAIIAGYILGSTGTRWHFLISVSPLIITIIFQLGVIRSVSICLIVFMLLLPFSFIRNGEEFSLVKIMIRLPMELPVFESVNAIKMVGIHPDGISNFIKGIVLYPVPRFLFDKGFDQTLVDFNWARINVDIREYPATILPGLIGSLYMYGGLIMVSIFGFIFGTTLSYLDKKLIPLINKNPVHFTFISLFFIGLLLQLRNLSVGYFVPLILFYLTFYFYQNYFKRFKFK